MRNVRIGRGRSEYHLVRGFSAPFLQAALPTLSQDFAARTSAEPAAAAAAADPKGNDRSAYRAQDRMVWPVILGLTLTIAAAALGFVLLY